MNLVVLSSATHPLPAVETAAVTPAAAAHAVAAAAVAQDLLHNRWHHDRHAGVLGRGQNRLTNDVPTNDAVVAARALTPAQQNLQSPPSGI